MDKELQRQMQEAGDEFAKLLFGSKKVLVVALVALSCFTVVAAVQTVRGLTWLQEWPYVRGLDSDFFFGSAMIAWTYWFLISRLLMVWDK